MEQRRLLLAVGLSMAVIFVWQILFPPPVHRKPRTITAATDTAPALTADTTASAAIRSMPTTESSAAGESFALAEAARIPQTPARSIELDLPHSSVTLDETGGIIAALLLKDYSTLSPPPRGAHPVSLVSHQAGAIGQLALLLDPEDRSGLGARRWMCEAGSDSRSAVFSCVPDVPELPSGIRIEKRLTFSAEYGATLEITVVNLTNQPRALATARMRYELQDQTREGSLLLHLGPDLGTNAPVTAYIDQYRVTGSYERGGKHEAAVTEKSWWSSIFGAPKMPEAPKWAALENRYFVSAIEPVDFQADAMFSRDREKHLHLYLLLPSFNLDPGARKTFAFRIFAGPKSTQVLEQFDPALKILDGMEPTILPRSIQIARWMVGFLGAIHRHIGNWGWSIIILTIIVRGALFPLSWYQFRSMARMQRLQPRIQELQTRYAEDKERMQRELMKVYSEAGVNPLGGCLPIVLQMPILVGLFLAFQNAIDLRGVPFILWIRDLSIPDTLLYLPIINIPINPLPIVMCGTMFLTQKLTPTTTTDPAQRQMFLMMPVVMTVLFYNFPSGLSLYWVVQNILSVGQQYYMMKMKEVPKNAGT